MIIPLNQRCQEPAVAHVERAGASDIAVSTIPRRVPLKNEGGCFISDSDLKCAQGIWEAAEKSCCTYDRQPHTCPATTKMMQNRPKWRRFRRTVTKSLARSRLSPQLRVSRGISCGSGGVAAGGLPTSASIGRSSAGVVARRRYCNESGNAGRVAHALSLRGGRCRACGLRLLMTSGIASASHSSPIAMRSVDIFPYQRYGLPYEDNP